MESSLAKEVTMFRKKEARLSQDNFCKACGIPRGQLAIIERGSKPTEETYDQLSRFMGIPKEALEELEAKERRIGHQARKLH